MQMSYVQNFGPLDDEEPGAGVRVATRKPTFVNNNVSLFKINDNQRSPRPGPRVSVCQNRLIDKRTRGLAPTTTVAASSTHGTQKLEIGCFFRTRKNFVWWLLLVLLRFIHSPTSSAWVAPVELNEVG